jgi:predicted ATP-grasp superfamily ATP-dependent carboligase
LIAGVSTRAVAASAARAGFRVTAIDAFADLDQHPSVRMVSPQEGFSCDRAARASRDIDCDAVVYLAGFENHPDAVATLASGRALWGNPPEILRRVRDPIVVARAFRDDGHSVPEVRRSPASEGRWLLKPLARGGGHRVRPWRGGESVPRDCYLQEFVEGAPGAVAFVAAAGSAVPLGVSRQLIGDGAFGADGYQYCGSVLAASKDASFVQAACALAATSAREFGLVGVNGIDFVAREGVPYPVEINPRWTASMELAEQAYGLSVFAAHATACAGGILPEFDLLRASRRRGAVGKAIVFAQRDVTAGDTRAWLREGSGIRDVPRSGHPIRAGRPVCTVFAESSDEVGCYTALVERAGAVYAELR